MDVPYLSVSTRVLLSLIAFTFAASAVSAQSVRVRLLDLASPTRIALSGDGLQLFAGDFAEPMTHLDSDDVAIVSRASNQLHVSVGEMVLYATSLRAESNDDAGFGLAVHEGSSTQERQTYAGRLFVSMDSGDWEIKLVNELPLEEYVASVVAGEYGFEDLEGSKAMAVLVRTYALAALGKYGPEYDHVDHSLSQVYRGSSSVTAVSRRAAVETSGQVLMHDGKLIRAVYFAASGGHTADNESVWEGEPLPYLRGKHDPYGTSSPHARWTTRISRPDLLQNLRAAYGPVEGFVITERSREGRVREIELLLPGGRRRAVPANEFRMLVIKHFGPRSLRSAFFDAERQGNEYVFQGRGYGHGVGLSQWGAHDMAERGRTYEEILQFYYTDVELGSLGDPTIPAEATAPVAGTAEPEETQPSSRRIGW